MLKDVDFYGFYMICLLLLQNLNEAKYLWKRAPSSVKSNVDSAFSKLWGVGRFLWENQIPNALNELNSQTWSPQIQPLIIDLKMNIVTSQVKSLRKLFPTLTVQKLSQSLGISEVDLVPGIYMYI